jgi:hypothetical protein
MDTALAWNLGITAIDVDVQNLALSVRSLDPVTIQATAAAAANKRLIERAIRDVIQIVRTRAAERRMSS